MVTALHERGWQVAAHSVGDGAHDLILNAFESALAGESNEKRRHRIEHLLVLRDDQISRMALLRIVASIQLTSTTSDLPTDDYWEPLVPSLGEERLGLLARWRDLFDADVPTTGSTDTPWESATPMLAVYQAVTRIGPSGAAPLPWMEMQRITVAEALRLLTFDAAWGTNEDDVRGSLSQGKLADLVVLSHNPLDVAVDMIPRITIMMTMVGGQIWHCPTPCFGSVPF
jgi:predicted amidohydrolase YtcJ